MFAEEDVKITDELLLNTCTMTNVVYEAVSFKILHVNQKFCELFECADAEELLEFSQGNFMNLIAPEDRENILHTVTQLREMQINREHDVFYRIQTRSGRILEIEDRGTAARLDNGLEIINCALFTNEKGKVLLPESIDRLTGFFQREAFYSHAQEILERAARQGVLDTYYVVYTNIRHFKYYNLRYGVDAGDSFLKNWAQKLKSVSPNMLHGSFTGDNLVCLANIPNAVEILDKINKEFEEQYGRTGMQFKVGIYSFENHIPIEEACDMAKIACDSLRYEKNHLCFYNKSFDDRLSLESYVIQNLSKAIQNKYITVYYQPIIRTISGKLCGMEALVRWIEPNKFLMPGDFIPTFEKNHLITKLDLYVLDEVCRLMREKMDLGYINVPVAVNLSRLDFLSCDIVEEIEKIVHKYGMGRDMLNLEITESMVMNDPTIFEREIKRLRELGYTVMLDDFGSGYSSLNVLRNFDLDEIKLDMVFLRNFDNKSRQVIRSIVSMAKELNIHVLAEGVETQEQYDFLRSIGCEKVQGYLFSKPVYKDDFRDLYIGREELIENRIWRNFYESVGRVNFITDKAMAVLEYDGHEYEYIYANKRFLDGVSRITNTALQQHDELKIPKNIPTYDTVHRFLTGLRLADDMQEIEFPFNNYVVRYRVMLLAEEHGHRLYAAEAMIVSSEDDVEQGAEAALPGSNQPVQQADFAAMAQHDEYVKHSLLNSSNLCFFWKDLQRRFVGANNKYLETVGFSSLDAIVGRTNEDIGWHIDDYKVREIELKVINEGVSVKNHLGKCLIKGEYKDIIYSKEPLYANGKVIGLLGTFMLAEDLPNNGQIADEGIDVLSGLNAMSNLTQLISEYNDALVMYQQKFGMITLVFPSYKRTSVTYGIDVVNTMVNEIGTTILQKWGALLQGVRVQGAEMLFFMQYQDAQEVHAVAAAMEKYFRELHTMAGYNVTVEVNAHAYCLDDFADAYAMIDHVLAQFNVSNYIGGKLEQLRMLDILSRVPAAIAIFSVAENYAIRRIYLSEQAKYFSHLTISEDCDLSDMVMAIHPDDRSRVYKMMHAAAVERKYTDIEFRCLPDEEGRIFWNRLVLLPFEQKDGSCLLYGVYADITDLKDKTEALQVKVETDALTGLRNRHALHEDLPTLFGTPFSVAILDIDSFKNFNDNYGHSVGDAVIQICADAMKEICGEYLCYRYGGDEFLIIAPQVDEELFAKRLKRLVLVANRKSPGENIPSVLMSYGYASGTGNNLEEMRVVFRRADYFLYKRKEILKADRFLALDAMAQQLLDAEAGEIYTYEELVAKYDNYDKMIYVSDVEDYSIVFFNKIFRDIFVDYAKSDANPDKNPEITLTPDNEFFRGKKCYEILQLTTAPCAMCNNGRLCYDKALEWNFFNPQYKHFLHLTDKLITVDGRTCRMEMIEVVQDTSKVKDYYKDSSEDWSILNEALRMAAYEKEPNRAIAVLMEYLARYTGATRANIAERERDDFYNNTYEWCRLGTVPDKDNRQHKEVEFIAFWEESITEGEPIGVSNLEDIRKVNPLLYKRLMETGIKSILVYPLWRDDKINGFFSLENPRPEYIDKMFPIMRAVGRYIDSLMKSRDLVASLRTLARNETRVRE